MALAHIRGGIELARFSAGGWIVTETGVKAPVIEGATYGNDKIVPVVRETVGDSGPDINSARETIVEADRVVDRVTYTSMTPQEIADRDAAQKDAEANGVDDVLIKVITNHENRIRTLEGRSEVTEQQVRTFLRSLLQ